MLARRAIGLMSPLPANRDMLAEIVETVRRIACDGRRTFDEGERAGKRVALLIKDLNPDRLTVWFEDPPPADDCDSMIGNIPREVIANDSFYTPLEEGNFTLSG